MVQKVSKSASEISQKSFRNPSEMNPKTCQNRRRIISKSSYEGGLCRSGKESEICRKGFRNSQEMIRKKPKNGQEIIEKWFQKTEERVCQNHKNWYVFLQNSAFGPGVLQAPKIIPNYPGYKTRVPRGMLGPPRVVLHSNFEHWLPSCASKKSRVLAGGLAAAAAELVSKAISRRGWP